MGSFALNVFRPDERGNPARWREDFDEAKFHRIGETAAELPLAEYRRDGGPYSSGKVMGVVLLNPNEQELDPAGKTMRALNTVACIWGYATIRIGFLFEQKTGKAADLDGLELRTSAEADRRLAEAFTDLQQARAKVVPPGPLWELTDLPVGLDCLFFCWGTPTRFKDPAVQAAVQARGEAVRQIVPDARLAYCFGKHRSGNPWSVEAPGRANHCLPESQRGGGWLSRDTVQDVLEVMAAWTHKDLSYIPERTYYDLFLYGLDGIDEDPAADWGNYQQNPVATLDPRAFADPQSVYDLMAARGVAKETIERARELEKVPYRSNAGWFKSDGEGGLVPDYEMGAADAAARKRLTESQK